MVPKRISLEPSSGIESSYKKKYKQEYWDIEVFKEGNHITPDFYEALLLLDRQIRLNGGLLRITDLYRSWQTQAENREKYLSGKKRAYVAKPGGSFHNAGRAVDIGLEHLSFEGVDKEDWLEVLWDIAKPIGFKPIIRNPDMNASEAWHFDFPGKDWEHAYKYHNYSEVAKCCVLDVGKWDPSVSEDAIKKMFIQSQLIRLGKYEIGKVDGILGSKTKKALSELGLSGFGVPTLIEKLSEKPTVDSQ